MTEGRSGSQKAARTHTEKDVWAPVSRAALPSVLVVTAACAYVSTASTEVHQHSSIPYKPAHQQKGSKLLTTLGRGPRPRRLGVFTGPDHDDTLPLLPSGPTTLNSIKLCVCNSVPSPLDSGSARMRLQECASDGPEPSLAHTNIPHCTIVPAPLSLVTAPRRFAAPRF